MEKTFSEEQFKKIGQMFSTIADSFKPLEDFSKDKKELVTASLICLDKYLAGFFAVQKGLGLNEMAFLQSIMTSAELTIKNQKNKIILPDSLD